MKNGALSFYAKRSYKIVLLSSHSKTCQWICKSSEASINRFVRAVKQCITSTNSSYLCWSNNNFFPFLGYQVNCTRHIWTCSWRLSANAQLRPATKTNCHITCTTLIWVSLMLPRKGKRLPKARNKIEIDLGELDCLHSSRNKLKKVWN